LFRKKLRLVEAVLYLQSSGFVTGENLRVDGGVHAGRQYAVNELNLRSTILDGEIVALDKDGIPRFQMWAGSFTDCSAEYYDLVESMKPVPPINLDQFDELVRETERLYRLGGQFSDAVANKRCAYLTFQASMAFNKSMMSLVGFLRFVPSSQFYAKESQRLVDISSACVLARQVLEDLLALFYLSQHSLSPEQEEFRVLVWKYHGFCEAVEASRLAVSTNPDLSQAKTLAEQMLQKIEAHPLFVVQSSTAKGRIRKGQVRCLLHDEEILAIRGIKADYYNLPRKVLSNLAHFWSLSVSIMNATSRDWSQSWNEFILPTYHVVRFVSEGLTVFTEVFPEAEALISTEDKQLIDSYRDSLRE
jgi:hypothetical protein